MDSELFVCELMEVVMNGTLAGGELGRAIGTRLMTWLCASDYAETAIDRYYEHVEDRIEAHTCLARAYAELGASPALFAAQLCRLDKSALAGILADVPRGSVHEGIVRARLATTCFPLRESQPVACMDQLPRGF
jgi:hypothetical protein